MRRRSSDDNRSVCWNAPSSAPRRMRKIRRDHHRHPRHRAVAEFRLLLREQRRHAAMVAGDEKNAVVEKITLLQFIEQHADLLVGVAERALFVGLFVFRIDEGRMRAHRQQHREPRPGVVALIHPLEKPQVQRLVLRGVEMTALPAVVERIFGAFEMIELQAAQPACLVEKREIARGQEVRDVPGAVQQLRQCVRRIVESLERLHAFVTADCRNRRPAGHQRNQSAVGGEAIGEEIRNVGVLTRDRVKVGRQIARAAEQLAVMHRQRFDQHEQDVRTGRRVCAIDTQRRFRFEITLHLLDERGAVGAVDTQLQIRSEDVFQDLVMDVRHRARPPRSERECNRRHEQEDDRRAWSLRTWREQTYDQNQAKRGEHGHDLARRRFEKDAREFERRAQFLPELQNVEDVQPLRQRQQDHGVDRRDDDQCGAQQQERQLQHIYAGQKAQRDAGEKQRQQDAILLHGGRRHA